MNKGGAGAPSELMSQGTILNKGGNDFDGLTSDGSSMFIRGPNNQANIMDESSAGGSVLQRANDDQESFMGLVNDQSENDNGSAYFDGDKGMQKVQTDGKL